jgi:cation diffusion facilitator family transporter
VTDRPSLRRYAVISILAALATIALKGGAYVITGSVGLLSDALESLVNLAAAVVALIALGAAARPEDEDHRYGHSKAEYFSSGFEGALILLAAASIIYASVGRLLQPRPIEQIAQGAAIAIAASLINLMVARRLVRAGKM